MSRELRWTIVVVVLAAAGVVALWPRGDGSTEPSRVQDASGLFQRAPQAPDDAELARLRARPDLAPCPAAGTDPGTPSAPLAGITVPCLGEPGGVDLGATLAGKPALLNVWASWCGPCRDEIPALEAYATRPGAIPVVGIDVLDDPGTALRLLADLGAHYPSVTDPGRELQRALRVPPVLPVSYVLRPDGTVRPLELPRAFDSPDQIARAVARALH